MTLTINTIDELTEIILSKQFSDKQIKTIIERALTVLFVNEPLPPRKRLAEMVIEFYENYSGAEKPIFFDDDFNIDVE